MRYRNTVPEGWPWLASVFARLVAGALVRC